MSLYFADTSLPDLLDILLRYAQYIKMCLCNTGGFFKASNIIETERTGIATRRILRENIFYIFEKLNFLVIIVANYYH